MPEAIPDTDPAKAAYHVEQTYNAAIGAWSAAVKTGNPLAIEKAEAVLAEVKKARLYLPTPDPETAPPSDTLSLSDLTAVHQLGPEFDELRGKLAEALEIAERIDQARGRSYPESVGGSRGYDLAEHLVQTLAYVEREAGGSVGRGLE